MRLRLPLRDLVCRSAVLAALALAACARSGPPAPVVHGGPGQYIPPAPQQASLPPPAARPAPAAPTRGRSVVVKPGETIYSVARDQGVPLRALIDANRLQAPYTLTPGQRLIVPLARYHIVQRGETLYGVARKYGVDMRAIVQANNIPPPYGIVVGQKLALPGGGQPAVVATATAAPPANRASVVTSALPPPSAPAPQTATAPDVPPSAAGASSPPEPTATVPPQPTSPAPAAEEASLPPADSGGRFLWPVRGRILVAFGPRGGGLHNDGINIAAREGTPIRAAAAGVVAYAGNELQGFGNLLLIRHPGDVMTAYAHASAILVKRGDTVQRGQVIARVGRTGNVSSPQLHFEVRRHDKPVDPMSYLTNVATGRSSVITATASRDVRRDPE
jgi:murein DD-endopeptidase MepM/ murein hydrolase activator NlpD